MANAIHSSSPDYRPTNLFTMLSLQFSLLATLSFAICPVVAQANATLGLANGFITLASPSFSIQLVKDSQTLASLKPKPVFSNNPLFDFVPFDQLSLRQYNGNYHVGDVTFRARKVGATAWTSGDSSISRKPVTALSVTGNTLAAADLAPTLPSNSLLNITRRWVLNNGNLQLLFDVVNHQTTAVEIGSFGIPQEWNNIFTGRTASNVNQNCSLFDPYIGLDAGFIQVTPLIGTSGALVITSVGKTPFEGWHFLPENTANPPYYQSQTFEGLYEWQVHTLAYAQNEWANASPWNPPTSFILQPGASRTYGLQFNLASSIRAIENTVRLAEKPVAVGVPGYVLASDQTGKLFLNYSSAVSNISVSPGGGITWKANIDSTTGWQGYDLTPGTWGRVRLTITYMDGTLQTVHYFIQAGATQTISNLGNWLLTSQWYTNTSDPFHRAPSVISYDRSVNTVVLNDPRVWISGLSDEAGAGSWLAASMKQYVQPNAAEVSKLQLFAFSTLGGVIQNANSTVKKSVFYYQPGSVPYNYPTNVNWGNWWSWNQANAYATDRAYDYVHVTAAWWSLYRVARNYPSIVSPNTTNSQTPWSFYLSKAFNTVATMTNSKFTVGYVDDGLMGETVFRVLLDDLQREGWTANATALANAMKNRWSLWSTERYPFGSEMAWDSTGQEGVYAWSKYFNDTTTRVNALNSILAYQPLIPHWGYNGNARRYWDNIYGGKLQRYERQIHHYGSGLNAVPLITEFMSNPTDWHLLRTGFGGLSGALSNIDQQGFASASFHSFADTLAWDAYSGDYGPNFVGHSLGMTSILVNHPDFGWQAFGGNVVSKSSSIVVNSADSVRRRVFIAPTATLCTLDAGAFASFSWNPANRTITLSIISAVSSAAAAAPAARLLVTQTAPVSGVATVKISGSPQVDAGAYVLPFSSDKVTATLVVSS